MQSLNNATLKPGSTNPAKMRSLRWSSALLRLATFVVVGGLAAYILDGLIKHGLKHVNTSDMGSLNQAMQGKVNADIIISGSSRALVQFDPRIIQQATGRRTFNVARNASNIDLQLAFLKAYLRHNAKPQLIVQNLDLHSFGLMREVPDATYYDPYLDEPEIYDAFRVVNHDAWKWKHLPLYCFAVEDSMFMWTSGLARVFGINPRQDFFDGFNPRNKPWTDEFDNWKRANPTGIKVDYEAGGVEAMTDLLKLCKDNDIAVVLVFSPIYGELNGYVNNRAAIFRKFGRLSKRFNVPVWDYSESSFSKQKELFYNSQHMNARGAELFSRDLAVRLKGWIADKGLFRETRQSATAGIAESSASLN